MSSIVAVLNNDIDRSPIKGNSPPDRFTRPAFVSSGLSSGRFHAAV